MTVTIEGDPTVRSVIITFIIPNVTKILMILAMVGECTCTRNIHMVHMHKAQRRRDRQEGQKSRTAEKRTQIEIKHFTRKHSEGVKRQI